MATRLLDPNEDVKALDDILTRYLAHVKEMPNPVYPEANLRDHARWIKEQFRTQDPRHFKVSGNFIDGTLMQIIVGYRVEVVWTRYPNILPAWVMGLLYFDKRSWKSPASNFRGLNKCLNQAFEEDDCTTFYVVQKVSPKLLATEDSRKFFSKEHYYKTLPYDRYNVTLENIFMNQQELEAYRNKFTGIAAALPRNILRPVMFLSARLDHFNKVT
jgi:hypothetical protein